MSNNMKIVEISRKKYRWINIRIILQKKNHPIVEIKISSKILT